MGVIDKTLEILKAEPGLSLTYDPPFEAPRDGVFVELSESSLHPNVLNYLKARFPSGLFRHQHEAVEAVLGGSNTVVATRTSSGKSLIYSLPVFDALIRDHDATAMFLFPQKALANDQHLKLREMSSQIKGIAPILEANQLLISRYDGSTPQEKRKPIRDSGQVILTNPDMLHLGMMQYHQANWERSFGSVGQRSKCKNSRILLA